jgi:hypothetical protein
LNFLLIFQGFAFVGNENSRPLAEEKFGRKIYILQSPEFKLEENKAVELQFDILKMTNSIAFQVHFEIIFRK